MSADGDPGGREPKLARRSPFAPETKLCPKCLTPLKTILGIPGMTPPSYLCPKCGYSGIVFLEKETEGR